MTEKEIGDMLESNPEIDQHVVCLALHTPSGWALVIGETQSDGIFRHVDVAMEDTIAIALGALRNISPEGRTMYAAKIAAAREGGGSA